MRRTADRLLVTVLMTSLAVLGCGLSGIDFEDPQNVEISVEAPTTVEVGERFEILARMRNTATSTQILIDLDIADEYLEGVVIESMEPAFSDVFHVPLDDTMSYSLDLPVPAGDEVIVTLHVLAAKTGDFSGDFDFCIGSETSFLSARARTLIR